MRPRYENFRFFKMVAAAILSFQIFKFLTVGTVKWVELPHDAKFHRHRSNRDLDMAIFLDFSRWRPQPSWIFEGMNFWRSERSSGSNCVIVPNFVETRKARARCEHYFQIQIRLNYLRLNLHISAAVQAISAKFGPMTKVDLLKKSKMAAAAVFKNKKLT